MKPGERCPGILGTVVAERRTMRGDDPGGDPAGLQFPGAPSGVQAFLAAPIASPAHVYGWICLVGNEGRTFTEDDEHLVMALSGQVGRIYENGYFYAVAQKRAEELEARDLSSASRPRRPCATSATARSATWTRPTSSCSRSISTGGSRSSIATPATSWDGPAGAASDATGSRPACRPTRGTRAAEVRERSRAAICPSSRTPSSRGRERNG